MADAPFPILGASIPTMLGRAGIMQRLWNDLTKATPSHLSIVGPRYSGKTVLMHGLVERLLQGDSPYGLVIVWDLGHQTPDSNDAFLKALCRTLGDGLKANGNEYGEHLLAADDNEYGELREVLETLHGDGFKVLMLWDGFDKPLSTGKLTRNLWDQLRELASSPSLRLVTSTRRPLHELIRSEESVTSDFWNIFDMTPVRVGVFDENDRAAIMEKITDFTLKSGAKSELENWSTGYPPLYLALLNHIMESGATGEIDNQMVNDAAGIALDGVSSILHYLWNDCPETAKNLYRHLVEHNEIAASDVGISERTQLVEKGFIKVAGGRVSKGCRFLEQHIKSLGEDAGSMVRLFGPWEEYRGNIRGLLELRLNQLTSLDASLRRYLQRSIEDIPEHPEVCLSSMRGIVDRALDLIWDAELGPARAIPATWFTEWQHNGERGAESYWDNQFPVKRGHQLRLLQLMTGTQNSASKARRVSKNTWALASSAHGFGDFGQHIDGIEIPVGVAVSAVNVCLELAACLEKELVKE
ncbi:MAG: hypothetical protein VR65_19570 [Desulfobulbaceae bacterium BRH_c16a]|nr:MAG: hypothetical protein VR65_19570 [Desulfobulbaceae bacterium BRH_c16a]